MSDVVVDTDVVSFLFKRDTRAQSYRRHLLGQTLYISFMSVAELRRWALVSKWGAGKIAQLDRYLQRFNIMMVDLPLCDQWAEVMDMTHKSGHPMNSADAWIAATCIALGCPVITHNAADFQGVRGLTVISEAP